MCANWRRGATHIEYPAATHPDPAVQAWIRGKEALQFSRAEAKANRIGLTGIITQARKIMMTSCANGYNELELPKQGEAL